MGNRKAKKSKLQKRLDLLVRKKYLGQISDAKIHKRKRLKRKIKQQLFPEIYSLRKERVKFHNRFYKKKYHGAPQNISIDGSFGIEVETDIENFLDKASGFVDFSSSRLNIFLENCNYMWPSGITLFCSLKEFIELAAKKPKPIISSSTPNNKKVKSYLNYSGFYEYVNRIKDKSVDQYYEKRLVKIIRESDYNNLDHREAEIMELLTKFSFLNATELEWFYNVILTEVFLNMIEHGVAHTDKGYWLMAQHHPTHGFISICVADNGIGIRHSLMTGPQGEILNSIIKNESQNDGEFIKLVFQQTVSGAIEASIPTKRFMVGLTHPRGSSRGNGMKRIKERCVQLGIAFSILSQHGYLFMNESGEIIKCGSKPGRIFAGTLFNFRIKAKSE